MADLSIQTFDEGGTDLTLSSAAAGGDEFDNNGNRYFLIKNGSGGEITVTVTAQNTDYEFGLSGKVTKSDQTLAVSAGGEGIMGPFPTDAFNDSNEKVQVTYSGVTSLEVAVIEEG